MTAADDHLISVSSGEVRILPPDFALKKMIGEDVDIQQIFSSKNIEKAQNVINQHKDSFLEWVAEDLAALNEHYKKALNNLTLCEIEITKLSILAAKIKSQAGTFGFGLATLISKSMENFCYRHPRPVNEHMVVLRKHIDTLLVIFNKKVIGDGGAIGKELLDNLSKLVSKYN